MISTHDIFTISNQKQFDKIALKVFRFQYENNEVYREFCDFLKTDVQKVKSIEQIPFLPIQFFKSHSVVSTTNPIQTTFTSSGTTGMITSKHLVTDVSIYEESYRKGFSQFYGNIEDYAILALLPSYLEREGSSLIHMVDDLIQLSNHPESGFYLHNYDELIAKLLQLDQTEQNVILIGVTYALLDLVEKHSFQLENTIIMETGGMKGKRKEMIREELHQQLCNGFGVNTIHSEYGMTELLSQAYSIKEGVFKCPPWMKVMVAEEEDPTAIKEIGRGVLHIIDLTNIYSCSFIATEDIGEVFEDGSFTVLGRLDASARRGCSLLVV